MNSSVIITLVVLWFALVVFLVLLIRRWYIRKSVTYVKGKKASKRGSKPTADDLKEMIGKTRGALGGSAIPKESLREKLGGIDIKIYVARVKTWLKEADRDKLKK